MGGIKLYKYQPPKYGSFMTLLCQHQADMIEKMEIKVTQTHTYTHTRGVSWKNIGTQEAEKIDSNNKWKFSTLMLAA